MPARPAGEHLRRLLVLVPWVMARGSPTVDEVCAEFQLTPEALREDIDLLLMCGLPPFSPGDRILAQIDGDRVSIELADYLRQPFALTAGEAEVLYATGEAVLSSIKDTAEAPALRSALEKLRRVADPVIDIDFDPAPPFLPTLRDAIHARRRVRFEYRAQSSGVTSHRTAEPHLVFTTAGHWYMTAHDVERKAVRMFRLDRMSDLRATEERFDFPEGFDHAVAARLRLTASPHDVEVVFDVAEAGTWALERLLDHSTERLEDGWTRVTLRTAHLSWVVRLLLTLGQDARIESPRELSEALRLEAAQAIARYRGS